MYVEHDVIETLVQTPDIDWDNLEGVGKQSDLTVYG